MSNIIFVNRYFFPDHSATSQLLSDLSFHLAENLTAKDVRIVTSRQRYDKADASLPSYEVVNNVHIHRVWTSTFGRGHLLGRAVDYATFYLSAGLKLYSVVRKGDTIVAKTDPPLISVVAAVVARLKGARLVNWLQDLFPEVASALGVISDKNIIYRLLHWLRNWSLHIADMNVAIGELMAKRIAKEGIDSTHITVIHNWADTHLIKPIPTEENKLRKEWELEGKFVVGYSGNLGRAHEYHTIVDAAEMLKDEQGIVFLFIGDGALMGLLKDEVKKRGLGNFMFKPYQPRETLAESLSVPDVHLISLRPELEGLIVPSKFYGIIGVGKPSIFIGDSAGELTHIISREQCGMSLGVGEGRTLVHIVKKFEKYPELRNIHSSIKLTGKLMNSTSAVVEQWTELLLVRSQTSPG